MLATCVTSVGSSRGKAIQYHWHFPYVLCQCSPHVPVLSDRSISVTLTITVNCCGVDNMRHPPVCNAARLNDIFHRQLEYVHHTH